MAVSDYSATAGSNATVDGVANVAEGDPPGDINDAIRQIMADLASSIGTYDAGPLANTTVTPTVITKSASGNAGGASDWRGIVYSLNYSGANGAAQTVGANFQGNLNHTAGAITLAYGIQIYNSLGGAGATGVSTGSIVNSRVIETHTANKSSNGQVITDAANFFSNDVDLTRSGSTGTIGTMRSFYSGNQGHATKVTVAAIGYDQNDMTAGAPLTVGFRHQMGAGTGKWGFYGAGSANNAYGGSSSFGKITAPAEAVDVAGNVTVTGIYKVNGTQVVGVRQTGVAGNASDLATAITLVNDLRAKLIAHGLVS